MLAVSSQRGLYKFYLFIFAASAIFPCGAHAAPYADATVVPDSLACAASLRERLRTGVAFVSTNDQVFDRSAADFKLVSDWPVSTPRRHLYQMERATGRATGLGVTQSFIRLGERVERSVDLSLVKLVVSNVTSAPDGLEVMQVTVEAKRYAAKAGSVDDALTESLRQTFAVVPSTCSLELHEWSAIHLAPSDIASRWNAVKTTGAPGSPSRTSSRLVNVDFLKNARMQDELSRDPKRIDRSMRFFVFIDPDLPDVLLSLEPIDTARIGFDPVSGQATTLSEARVQTVIDGQIAYDGRLRWSKDGLFSSLESATEETSFVDEATWSRVKLGESLYAAATAEVFGGAEVLALPEKSLIARLNKPISFKNLSQYWNGIANSNGKTQWIYRLFVAQPTGLDNAIASPAVPEDDRLGRPELAPTKWIQSDLQTVRDYAHAISAASTGSRANIALQALARAQATLRFDEASALDTKTTAESIEAGRGGAPQIAALFVAIARAAGVPARLISGFFLKDKHVEQRIWAEYQASDAGPWLPVEPLAEDLEFPQGRYIPIAISSLRDNTGDEAGVAHEREAFFNLRGQFGFNAAVH